MAQQTRRAWFTGVAAVGAIALLAGCGGGGGDAGASDDGLLVWTVEDDGNRFAAQQELTAAFTEASGVPVELVAIAEDELSNVLAASVAAGEVPDVIGAVSITGINRLSIDDLIDTEANAAVVEALDASTFAERALELTQSADGEQLGVPSDGWAQLLYYRTDLFEQAGLEAPTTYEAIQAAAEALNADGTAGIVAASAPADSFTQQTFEHFALANGCQLVEGGEVALTSDACIESFDFYSSLLADSSVQGTQDADTTRASYFAGQAAMVVWSSFLLDELAGLRDDALPTCAECAGDPAFLAANTGVVGSIQGPDASEGALFGEIVSWTALQGSSDRAQDFMQHMMSEAYVDWLSIAPEGKVPTRAGTAENPTEYADAWRELEIGVDTRQPLAEAFPAEVLDEVVAAPESFDRWGIAEGEGQLYASVAGQFVVPQALSAAISGGMTGEEAAEQAQGEAETVQQDLGGGE